MKQNNITTVGGKWTLYASAVTPEGRHSITFVVFQPGLHNLNAIIRKNTQTPSEEHSMKKGKPGQADALQNYQRYGDKEMLWIKGD